MIIIDNNSSRKALKDPCGKTAFLTISVWFQEGEINTGYTIYWKNISYKQIEVSACMKYFINCCVFKQQKIIINLVFIALMLDLCF